MSIRTCWSFLAQQSQFLKEVGRVLYFREIFIQYLVQLHFAKICWTRVKKDPREKCSVHTENVTIGSSTVIMCRKYSRNVKLYRSLASMNEKQFYLFLMKHPRTFYCFFISMWFLFLNLPIRNTNSRINVLNRSRSNAAFLSSLALVEAQ